MFTEIDEQKGLVKVYWQDVRERVAKVEPLFAKLVDELNPGKTLPLFLAYYPYGAAPCDTRHAFVPDQNDMLHCLADPNLPPEIIKHLGYGQDTSPLALVLEKEIELCIDLPSQGLTIPYSVCPPGSFYSVARMLNRDEKHRHAPNTVFSAYSGARSAFVLANIGRADKHINIRRDFGIQLPPPKFLYDHWHIFKAIVNSKRTDCDWRSCVMFFSEKWLEKLHNDKAWLNLKMYLFELIWQRFEYERNRVLYDLAFSIIQKKRNLKPNPYLMDTVRHLFAIASGKSPGYAPACNNEALPLDLLENVYVNSYDLNKYFFTIMHPSHFAFEHNSQPIYYSLQHPSTLVFSPKAQKSTSTLSEMHEVHHIMSIYKEELLKEEQMCSDTVIMQIAEKTNFHYFHNEIDLENIIKLTDSMMELDSRFQSKNNNEKAIFAKDAPFIRGCIGIYSDK